MKSSAFINKYNSTCSASSEISMWSVNMKFWWKRGHVVGYIHISWNVFTMTSIYEKDETKEIFLMYMLWTNLHLVIVYHFALNLSL
jgi:hypothetical protein